MNAIASSALAIASEKLPHAVVLDVDLPDRRGLELISFIRSDARYAATPLVIVSTESSEEDRRRGLALGANAYLVKPFSVQELTRVVEDLLPGAKP